jgi:hypothetical protein
MRSSIHAIKLQLSGAIIVLLSTILMIQFQTGSFSAGKSSNEPETRQLSAMAVLTVPGNRAVSVNNTKTISGATILSGATIATPNQVNATVMIASFGTLDIAPDTILKTEFDPDVKVTLAQGCAILHARRGAAGEVMTPRGVAGRTNSSEGGSLEVCYPQRAGPGSRIEQDEAEGVFHLVRAAALALIGGRLRASTAVGLDDRGSNPGPSTP